MNEKPESFWKRQALSIKAAIVALLVLFLLIPKSMIESLINERMYRQQDAVEEVSAKWAKSQNITGPILTIPYNETLTDKEDKPYTVKRLLHILPEDLKINGMVDPQIRYRGIFEVPVYTSEMDLKGQFQLPDLSALGIKPEEILWNEAIVNVGISDLRGIANNLQIKWNNSKQDFEPGTSNADNILSGVHARVPFTNDSSHTTFEINLSLRGSMGLYFSPVGKSTEVHLQSSWVNPQFDGEYFPNTREINDSGFIANWQVSHLNRNFPQYWTGKRANVQSADFGVDLFLPADNYQQSTRSVKYAILFIGLTFLVFYFVEAINKIQIHPVQYILIGLALILFYALLVSISEQMTFNIAYLISSIATVLLIGVYTKTIFKSWNIAFLQIGILTLLYGFIFTIISVEEYALLMGSIGLFVILATSMYFSKKIEWYKSH